MAFNLGSVVAHIDADITGFKNGMNQVNGMVETTKGKLSKFGDSMGQFGKTLGIVGAAASVAAIPVTMFFKSASEEAMNLEKNLTTLDIISERFGVSGTKAKDAAMALGAELRIGVGASANGLQNLLKAGLNLEQATDLMKRFTNEAITGKSSSITLAQAVENLTFSYATNNSAIGNLSGINENYINIIDKGREALIKEGIAANTITDDMAKYRGMIDLTNLTMGSSERFTGSLIDKQAQLDTKITELKVSFGQLINPYLTQLVEMLIKLVDWFNGLSTEHKKLILIIGALAIAIGPILIIISAMATGLSVLITVVGALGTALAFLAANPVVLIIAAIVALIAVGVLIIKNWDFVKAKALELWDFLVAGFWSLVGKLQDVGHKILDAITKPFRDAWDTISGIVNKIKDALDFTKRHSPSIVDIVKNSVSKVNDALGDLAISGTINANAAGLAVSNGGAQNSSTVVSISMAGAIIADGYGANQMAELMGDAIIKRLQQNIRV